MCNVLVVALSLILHYVYTFCLITVTVRGCQLSATELSRSPQFAFAARSMLRMLHPSLSAFRSRVKTHLFRRCYLWMHLLWLLLCPRSDINRYCYLLLFQWFANNFLWSCYRRHLLRQLNRPVPRILVRTLLVAILKLKCTNVNL